MSGGFFTFSWFPFIFSPIEISWSWCLKLSGSSVYEFPHPRQFYWLQKEGPFQGACLYTCSRHLSSTLSSAVLPSNAGGLGSNIQMWAASTAKSMSADMGCLFWFEKICWRMQQGRQAVERRPTSKKGSLSKEPGVVFKAGRLISLMSGNETWQMSKV